MTDPVKPPLDVDALVRRLPHRVLGAERSLALRRALLDAARPPPPWWTRRPGRGWLYSVVPVAAAAICMLIAVRGAFDPGPDPRPDPAATAAGPAPAAEPLPEGRTTVDARHTVRLTRGRATITAPPGARFEVDVRDDQVRRVTVNAGWVVIAGAHMTATMVVARQTWIPEAPSDAVAPPGPSAVPALTTASLAPAPDPASPTPPSAVPASTTASLAPTPDPASPTPPPTETAPAASPSRIPLPAAPPAPPARGAPTTRISPARVSAPPPDSAVGSSNAASQAVPAPAPPAATNEQDFRDGLRALLAGDPHAAVARLDRACGAPSTTQGDVCYWAAVAWLRTGDRVRARAGFAAVVTRWPTSTHAGEANVALGWLLLDAGDRAAARARFAAAADDRMPSVRAEAVRGLAAAP